MVSGIRPAEEWRALLRRVEDLGYSSLLVGDHIVEYHPPPLIALAWGAAVTKQLRLGTMVIANDYRHPAILAKDSATLDLLSDGRFELGIGAGWMQADYAALGIEQASFPERVSRLEEAVRIIKSCWAGETFDFKGDHYTLLGCTGRPSPKQAPHPPIMIGGGSARILRLAGEHADIVGIHPSTAGSKNAILNTQDDETLRKIGWVREGARDRFDSLELQMACRVQVTNDRLGAAADIASEFDVRASDVLTSGVVLVGSVDEICETLQERRARWGASYFVVNVNDAELFAPVVERLGGN